MSVIPGLVVTIAVALLIVLAIGVVFSGILLYSVRRPIVRTPAEYGLDYDASAVHER